MIGYIYLLAFAVLLKDSISVKENATGPLQSVYEIMEWLGKPALLGISAFAAYLVGGILQVHGGSIFSWQARIVTLAMKTPIWTHLEKKRREKRFRELIGELESGDYFRPRRHYGAVKRRRRKIEISTEDGSKTTLGSRGAMSLAAVTLLALYVHDRISGTGIRWTEAYSTLVNDFTPLGTRLLMASKELYGDYDRLSAEADLKINVGLSGLVLSSIAAATLDDMRWLTIWIPMAILIYRGLKVLREATMVMVQAIIAEVVKSPKFEALISTAEPLRDDGYR